MKENSKDTVTAKILQLGVEANNKIQKRTIVKKQKHSLTNTQTSEPFIVFPIILIVFDYRSKGHQSL